MIPYDRRAKRRSNTFSITPRRRIEGSFQFMMRLRGGERRAEHQDFRVELPDDVAACPSNVRGLELVVKHDSVRMRFASTTPRRSRLRQSTRRPLRELALPAQSYNRETRLHRTRYQESSTPRYSERCTELPGQAALEVRDGLVSGDHECGLRSRNVNNTVTTAMTPRVARACARRWDCRDSVRTRASGVRGVCAVGRA